MVTEINKMDPAKVRKAFADRLNTALDNAGVPPKYKGRQGAVAKMFSVSQKGARKWLEGEAMPESTRISGISKRLGVRPEWLQYGEETAESNQLAPSYNSATVQVPYYPDISASAGHGFYPESEATVRLVEYVRSELEDMGVQPNHAAIVQARGDSMPGVVNDGDFMILDRGDIRLRSGYTYAVSLDGDLLVKKVQRVLNGYCLVSTSDEFPPIMISDEDQATNFSVIGRVVRAWHRTI